jgi:phosphoribosylformylglycinamidine synthase subunit PurL
MTTDCTPRYCYADPVEGGKQAVAEAYRNLCAVGAKPLAITNCLNFGNPQRPEIMSQIVGCLEGMSEACIALDMPIVSGNVSLYNESKATGGGSAILPTPAIGAIGLLDDWSKSATIGFKAEGEAIYLIGENKGHLGQSIWLREIMELELGSPPEIDLDMEFRNGEVVRSLISAGLVSAVHDLSDGGLAVALAEMALAGNIGASIDLDRQIWHHEWLFGEDQGRYLVSVPDEKLFQWTNLEHSGSYLLIENVLVERIGKTGGDNVKFGHLGQIPLATLRTAHEGFFPALMGKAA